MKNTMNVIYLHTAVPRRVDKTWEACSVFQLEQKEINKLQFNTKPLSSEASSMGEEPEC